MQRLSRDHYTTVLDPSLPAALTIASGAEVLVETWDAYKGVWGEDQEPPELAPATGPIAVQGAMPGDALRIEILTITPSAEALHDVRAGRGFLGDTFTRRYQTVLPLHEGHLTFPGGISIALQPSIGLIATTPTAVQITASDSGPYGGDLDMKELVAGSTLWLPVFVPGGMLVLGDCHAVLGDGAVGGTGAECAAEVTLRITLEKQRQLPGPRVLTKEHFAVLASGAEVAETMRLAVQYMVDYLVQEKGMEPYNAYSLLSLAGDVRMSRTFRPLSPVKMLLSREVLEQIGH
ncbi:MAG: acetamidase/formamidase family protein [Candidatus Tectimicrobiota bacterium]